MGQEELSRAAGAARTQPGAVNHTISSNVELRSAASSSPSRPGLAASASDAAVRAPCALRGRAGELRNDGSQASSADRSFSRRSAELLIALVRNFS
jgi:hypothetical protein